MNKWCFFGLLILMLGCISCKKDEQAEVTANQTQLGSGMLNAVGNTKISAGAEKKHDQEITNQIESSGAENK